MFAFQFRHARLALAALALSATLAMPFAEPAHAIGGGRPAPADLVVKFVDTKVFGQKQEWPIISDPNGRLEAYFAVFNEGGSRSGTIFVEKWCSYGGVWANMTQLPLPTMSSMDPGDSELITVSCPNRSGPDYSPTTGARLRVRATEEPSTRQGNNMDQETWAPGG
jgi:hypothetical protein